MMGALFGIGAASGANKIAANANGRLSNLSNLAMAFNSGQQGILTDALAQDQNIAMQTNAGAAAIMPRIDPYAGKLLKNDGLSTIGTTPLGSITRPNVGRRMLTGL